MSIWSRPRRLHIRPAALPLAAMVLLAAGLGANGNSRPGSPAPIVGELVAPGVRLTPTAAPGSRFEALKPDIPADPSIRANQGVTTAVSPDGRTLLVLTSGYNYFADAEFKTVSFDEYVFVYDISNGGHPQKTQVIRVPNTFMGLAWHPAGREFYVAGGINDNVRVFEQRGTEWAQAGEPIALGHVEGNGLDTRGNASLGWLKVGPLAAGLAVNGRGTRLLVANLENDSVSLVDLERRALIGEIDLRPGKHAPSRDGDAGGEFPLWLAVKGNDKAYVSSLRDREVVVLDLTGDHLAITRRIRVPGNPNRMILDREQGRLIVALDNSDSLAVIDTHTDRVRHVIDVNVPFETSKGESRFTGSHPNSLALSPDDNVLYVTQGGTNSVAVVPLDQKGRGHIALIPTGWYPNSVSVSADGGHLYVVNAIGRAGPSLPGNLNRYVLQMRAAGLLSVPVPSAKELAALTTQVLFNNGALGKRDTKSDDTMAFLRKRVKHVIYIVKENRTYDQVLGDLEKGNGDPSLTMFPEPITPNHHQLARQFVTLDNFYCAGAVSGDGWVWSTAGRTTDFTEKTIAVNYAGRGLSYDYEGMNRNVNVSQRTLEERQAVNPFVSPPLLREPRKEGVRVFYPAATGLRNVSDPYYREYDMQLPDYWRFREWENEFDMFVKKGRLPNLSLIELPHDHFGSFGSALDGVNTPETQMADNDYALGLIVEKVARSPFADDTLIFVVEDDAQDGPDHVDSQRSLAYVIGPYVKQGAVASTHYSNPSMLRTIVDILGMEPMGLQVALAKPMSAVFDRSQRHWDYRAIVPEVLRTTQLPLPASTAANSLPLSENVKRYATSTHDAAYWEEKMKGQDFKRMDNLDTDLFNRVLWEGLMGPDTPYPTLRHGKDLSRNRQTLPGVTRRGH